MKRIVFFAAASLLIGAALPAQTAPQRQVVAATSSPSDSVAVIRANALLEELVRTDELVLRSAQPDRTVPGRIHEYFAQVHRGVPVRGAGLARQSADGVPVSVFGTTFADIDIDTDPGLDAEAALARMEALTGAARATAEPAELVIVPTMLGELVLAWSAPLQDYRTWFVDAHDGELVHRIDHFFTEAAVGSGMGITGERQKMSTWSTSGRYEARDRLRPAEIVTMNAKGRLSTIDDVANADPAWPSLVALDADNEWGNPAVVEGHANLGFTYDYLFKNQNWRGMDGKDGTIYSLVNLSFFNAFFLSAPYGPEGGGFVAFGETSDDVPLVPLDIAAHELMHGVTFSALKERTGSGLVGAHTGVLGPSTISVRGEVIRCGDTHFIEEEDEVEGIVVVHAPYLCYDEDGNPTTSRSGRFGLFLAHGGAINEAYSDIIGTAVEFATHPPGEGDLRADYRSGEDAGVNGRRMDRPNLLRVGGELPYPDAMGKEFRFVVALRGENLISYTRFGMQMLGNRVFSLDQDGYSGVHWNSTILSHAAYLAIEGGRHSSGRTVEGVGVANRGQIEQAFFRALVDLAPSRVTFPIMGRMIRQAAMDLHGDGSAASTAIDQALTAVGL